MRSACSQPGSARAIRLQGFLGRNGYPYTILDASNDEEGRALVERFGVLPGDLPLMVFHGTGHPIIEGYDPPEGWGWCYRDEVFLDLGDNTTPQDGPIPHYY